MKDERGLALFEILLAIAIFALLASAGVGALFRATASGKQGVDYVAASGLLQEGIEGVRSVAYQDFSTISSGTYHLDTALGSYALASGSESVLTNYTRSILVEDVTRTGSLTGDIAASGVADSATKKITISINWYTLASKLVNLSHVFYVYNFAAVQTWTQDLLSEFNNGSFFGSTAQAASGDGDIDLRTVSTDWSTLEELYTVSLPGSAAPIELLLWESQDELLVLLDATTGDELNRYDVSNVENVAPTLIDGIELGSYTPYDLAIYTEYGYVVTGDDAKEVVIVNLLTMTEVGSVDISGTEDAYDVAIIDSTLVVGRANDASGDEVFVYSLASPASPSFLGSYDATARVRDIALDSSYAYIATANTSKELAVMDLSDYSEVADLDLVGTQTSYHIAVSGTILYVSRDGSGTIASFYEIDITNPASSFAVGDSLITGNTHRAFSVDPNTDRAFVASTNASEDLQIIDLDGLTEDENIDLAAQPLDIADYGSYIFYVTSDGSGELVVMGPSTGGWAVLSSIGSANISGTANARPIVVSGDYAYIGTYPDASGPEFLIYDISTPSTPSLTGWFEIGAYVNDLVVDGNYAYLATTHNNRELDIIDISTKSSPTRAGFYDASGASDGIGLDKSGNYVTLGRFASTADEVFLIDVSSVASPSFVDSVNTGTHIRRIKFYDDYMYGAGASNELWIFDWSTPASLTSSSQDLTGAADAFEIEVDSTNEILYVGRTLSADPEIHQFDISTPGSPAELTTADVAGDIWDIFVESGGAAIYIASEDTDDEFQRWTVSSGSMTQQVTYDLNDWGQGVFHDGTYAYVASANDALELQILGPGSISDYAYEGNFTSQPYDSGSTSASWQLIEWTESGTGDIVFRIRTASSEAELADALWVGSDGTPATTFTTSGDSLATHSGTSGTQWFQWKAYMTGTTSASPVLEDVTISYVE
ncbi:MAG: hypothetical protein O3B64_00315 [bacterium]|nr:hypothetical protein [bacterium]MDA1024401.1 hypothetical protein [bacterium]